MFATSIALAAAALLAGALVDVRSTTDCPSTREIAAHLQPLLPVGSGQGSLSDIAHIEVLEARTTETELRIRLVRASGTQVDDRRVIVPSDCTDAAATVAAVIAAWETEPVASLPVGAPVARQAIATVAPLSTWQAFVGVAGGVGLVGGVAGVGRIEVLVGKSLSHWQARLGFTAEAARTLSLASGGVTGYVDWDHKTFELGVLLGTPQSAWPVSLDGGLALGWATLEGRGFSLNHRRQSFEVTGFAALRAGRHFGRVSVWAEARAYRWARRQRASLTGEDTSVDLPTGDVTAGVGVTILLNK